MDGRQPHGGRQPFGTRAEASQAFADHVDAGKTAALQAIDFDVVMGERAGARFADAYDGRWFWNCHCNGGVFLRFQRSSQHRLVHLIVEADRGLQRESSSRVSCGAGH